MSLNRSRYKHFFFGLDLAQLSDYAALSIVEEPLWLPNNQYELHRIGIGDTGWIMPSTLLPEQIDKVHEMKRKYEIEDPPGRPTLTVSYLERVPQKTPYPDIVEHVANLIERPPFAQHAVLLCDATGVGRPVIDMFARRLKDSGINPRAITITGGHTPHEDRYDISVPKRDLATTIQALLQSKRLEYPADLQFLDVLVHELQNFEVKITKTGNDVYMGREGQHDDLVLSVAMACWYREFKSPELYKSFCIPYITHGTEPYQGQPYGPYAQRWKNGRR